VAVETKPREIKWYDSVWLRKYLAAKEIVARVAPHRLEEFVHSFDVLRTDPGFSVREPDRFFDPPTLETIKGIVRSIRSSDMNVREFDRFGRMIVHNHPEFTKMQAALTDAVSRHVGEAVEPSYNFLSLYTQMGVCEPHLDAPSAKWTLDLCIDQSDPWPIHFSQIIPWPEQAPDLGEDWESALKNDPGLHFESKTLQPGEGIIFSGSSQWHYRDSLSHVSDGGYCHLLFFHYIPKGTGKLVSPKQWPRLFGIPELAEIPGIGPEMGMARRIAGSLYRAAKSPRRELARYGAFLKGNGWR